MTQRNSKPDVVLFVVQPDKKYRKMLKGAGVLQTQPDLKKREEKKANPGVCVIGGTRYVSISRAYGQLRAAGFVIGNIHLEEKRGGVVVCYIAMTMTDGDSVEGEVLKVAENLLINQVAMESSMFMKTH
ncbi:hypothetical protein IIA94_01990 [Patescibacteria group bacterium]|nr:hypothetical protein [Patescibacteria group bacterium]